MPSVDELRAVVAECLSAFKPDQCRNYFAAAALTGPDGARADRKMKSLSGRITNARPNRN